MMQLAKLSFYRLPLLLLLLIIVPCYIMAQESVTFHISNMEAVNPIGPWIFDADNPGFPPGFQDNQCMTFAPAPAYPYHLYTYTSIRQGVTTTITCTSEDLALVSAPADVSFNFGEHTLGGYLKVNSVNPNSNWNVMGEAADVRRYNSGTGLVKLFGVTKLSLLNSDLRIFTPWPSQAQMRASTPPVFPFAAWVGNVGTGGASTAYGWADIDIANSDPAWVAVFADVNNQVKYVITNVVYNIDFTQGAYSYDLQIIAATHEQLNSVNAVDPAVPATWTLPLPAQDLEIDFSAVTGGGVANAYNDITVNEINTPPDGNLPGGIVWTDVKFWDVMSTLGSFTTSITFDVSGLGLIDVADFRVMKRNWFGADWVIWNDYTVLDPTHVRANNLTAMGDFAIGSISDPLPVELSSFTATLSSENLAILNWSTQSESALSGYNIYRNNTPDQNTSVCLTTAVIPAHNTSTGSDYTFTDDELTENGTYYYWLESLDIDGTSAFFGPITLNFNLHGDQEIVPDPLHLGKSILTNYPNPFNPSTSIAFYLQNQDQVKVSVYNTRGQLVKHFLTGSYNPGWHTLKWDGMDNNGKVVPSGLYFAKLHGNNCYLMNKMYLIK
jgi:hypothetical protein